MIYFRQATIEDKPKILDFYRKVYPGNYEIRSSGQWDWQYSKNPYTSDKIGIWLAIEDISNEIVGHTGVIYEQFKLGAKKIILGWGIDLVVLPEYRGRKIAIKLQEYMMNQMDAYMNISMAYSTRLISNKLGAIVTSNAVQFMKPLFVPAKRIHHLRLLRTYKNNRIASKIKRRLFKQYWFKKITYYSGLDYLNSVYYKRKYHLIENQQDNKFVFKILHENDSFEEIDVLWNKQSEAYDKLAIRNSAYFKWKYFHQPHKTHRCYIIYESNHVPVGYLVIRDRSVGEPNVGIIVDYFFARERMDVFEAILKFADNKFKESKREFIYIVSSIPPFIEYLSNYGYYKTRVHTPAFLTFKEDLNKYIIDQPNNWFLTFTDHELDRYPMRGK